MISFSMLALEQKKVIPAKILRTNQRFIKNGSGLHYPCIFSPSAEGFMLASFSMEWMIALCVGWI